MIWIIDNAVNLTDICIFANWHLATVIEDLQEKGLSKADAQDFAQFAFSDVAKTVDCHADEWLSPEQALRLQSE